MPVELTTTQGIRDGSLCLIAFNELALRDGLAEIRRVQFPVSGEAPADALPLGEVLLNERNPFGAGMLLRGEDGLLVALSWGRGSAELAVAGTSDDLVGEVADALVARLRDDERDTGQVPVTFWAGGSSPVSPRRRVPAQAWEEIAGNYAAPTRAALDPLMAATGPGPGGLLLWHGEPGTGKSHALRALTREWQPWCSTWFISDPEAFLGHGSSYLLQSLLRSEGVNADGSSRHRLVVLEDAGELLAADARVQTGQALSRLLNLTDGLLGAGLRVVVLVTTNEPLRKLHPAVVRPGRCWAEVEFAPLPAQDADRWLSDRGVATRVTRATPLADLYAIADGRPAPEAPTVGFAPPRQETL